MAENNPVEELRQLVLYLATALVGNSDGIEVEAEQNGPTVRLNLRVPETELGRVIGKEGRIARAMRTIVTITSSRSISMPGSKLTADSDQTPAPARPHNGPSIGVVRRSPRLSLHRSRTRRRSSLTPEPAAPKPQPRRPNEAPTGRSAKDRSAGVHRGTRARRAAEQGSPGCRHDRWRARRRWRAQNAAVDRRSRASAHDQACLSRRRPACANRY